jgi:S1-C subfamily serine protease
MNTAQTSARFVTDAIYPLAISIGILIAIPSPSAAQAQIGKPMHGSDATHANLGRTADPLEQLSASMEALSARVSPGVVQVFSSGYNVDRDGGHKASDLLSHGSSIGSGIFIASDGWIVTNAHVVQGGRRIRVRLSQDVFQSGSQDGATRRAQFEAKLVAADRDTDLALLKIDAVGLPALELSDSSALKTRAVSIGVWQSAGPR